MHDGKQEVTTLIILGSAFLIIQAVISTHKVYLEVQEAKRIEKVNQSIKEIMLKYGRRAE